MQRNIITILFVLQATITLAQSTYTNSPRYWKNRKPTASYWQQDVHYTINANIDEEGDRIDATEELVYTNNSPDVLPFVYFHLYQNAFVKDSYLDELHQARGIETWFGKNSGSGLGTTVKTITVNKQEVKTELDNTILKVYLPQPLKPGEKCTFNIYFSTYWDIGAIHRRMKTYGAWGQKHFNGVHWYPRISVYDRKKGWDADQHLNKELYGDFGTFDVNLNFTSNFFVEATGMLQNKAEVFPGDLWDKVQIKNFANKKWDETPSIIIPYKPTERKTWKYHADFVHDFAFTADPSYRYSEEEIYGVKCIAVAQEPHCSKWQNASNYMTKIIKTFSDDFGMYEYPKIVAADAADGMEYPMITLDGGSDPGYRGLLVHEIGHNWFYGMIGSNETYRAALDEGFTQFITAWGLNKIDGPYLVEDPEPSQYARKHRTKMTVWDKSILYRYTNEVIRGDDKQLNTHSDHFNSVQGHENGYSLVYHKTASMLLNLQYTLGDTLFLKAMQHYVEKYKFAHPYFEDFREAIIEYTHVDLNWFFDQWLETTKNIDYSIVTIKKNTADSFTVKLQRKGSMQMPLDVTITAKDGKLYNYHIPNTNWFNKTTTATVLPKWYGWDKLNQTYTMKVNVPTGIRTVQIDTTYRLADVDMTNNIANRDILGTVKYPMVKLTDYGLRNAPNRKKIESYGRPDVWWNPIDGIKIGYHNESSYMGYLHKLNYSLWFNTKIATRDGGAIGNAFKYNSDSNKNINTNFIDAVLNYETPLTSINRKLFVGVNLRKLEGVNRAAVYSYWNLNAKENIRFDLVSLNRNYGPTYQNYSTEWSTFTNPNTNIWGSNAYNNYAQLQYNKSMQHQHSNSRWNITARTNIPAISKDALSYNYTYIQNSIVHTRAIKKLELRARGIARFGWGNAVPYESALNLAGGNLEEMLESKYYRTNFIQNNFANMQTSGFANLHMGGGLNLRGYNGYQAISTVKDTNYLAYKGRSGAAVNVEIDFDNYINWKPKVFRDWLHIDAYVFADAGSISLNELNIITPSTLIPLYKGWGSVRMDAGLGTIFTIKKWGALDKANPLSIRIDMPLFINTLPANYGGSYLAANRWLIGVGRSF